MRKLIYILLFLLFATAIANAIEIKKVYWEPSHPKEGDAVMVYAEIEGNISEVKLQYCIGDTCYYLSMEKVGELWKASFEAVKGKIEINITAKNDEQVYWNGEMMVKEKKMPGFEIFAVVIAIITMLRLKKL